MSQAFFQWAQLVIGSGILLVSLRVAITAGRYMQRLETLESSFEDFVGHAGPKLDRIQTDMAWLRGRMQYDIDVKHHDLKDAV